MDMCHKANPEEPERNYDTSGKQTFEIRSADGSADPYQMFLKALREIFTTAKGFKPEACRAESFETYLVGISKK